MAHLAGGFTVAGVVVVNREIQRLVKGIPDIRAPAVGWTDPVGQLDRDLDALLGVIDNPDERFVGAINRALSSRQHAVLYRYGVRLLGRGLSASDPSVLSTAAIALTIVCCDEGDYRDLMVKLAPLHVAATRLRGDASSLLGWVADRLPEGQRARIRIWGARASIEHDAYNWEVAATGDRLMFVPA